MGLLPVGDGSLNGTLDLPQSATAKSRKLGQKRTFRAQIGKIVKNEITFTYL